MMEKKDVYELLVASNANITINGILEFFPNAKDGDVLDGIQMYLVHKNREDNQLTRGLEN